MHFFGWLGRLCIASVFYLIDLTCFFKQAVAVWQAQRNIFNRAVYSVFLDQMILNGIHALAIISFLAIVVGISIASQLVFIIVSISGAKDLIEILSRLILSEVGPLITAVVMIGRSCSGVVVDLGNTKIAGEIKPLEYLGINVDDYFVLPRIISIMISQVILALYFSLIMLLFGMFFSVLIYDLQAEQSLKELFDLVTIDSFFRFMLKNIVFGTVIGTVACFHGLSVSRSPTEVSEQMHRAVAVSIVFIFLLDSYFIVYTL